MPIIKSAKKRVRVAEKASIRNFKTKRTLKNANKAFTTAVADKKGVAEAHTALQSAIDTAAKKNVLHANKAARLKASAAKSAKAAGAKPAAAKKAAKPATKKASTKKPASKPAAKKPATKKTTSKK